MKNNEEAVIQNLKDAGCDPDTIRCFMLYLAEGEVKKEQQLLLKHRIKLLDMLHACQKQIDCLDYLMYHIEKKKGVN